MLQLAYNLNGEPFEAPATMAAWRVRKLKKQGAPETVWGLDGLPLFLPMDADIEDLRHQSGGETGRFRLDPVDDHNKAIPNAPASYVCVHPIAPAPAPAVPAAPVAPAASETTSQLIAALLESQKQHTELARMYVSQFPVLANAMAGVVRSAGDVGLTARVPLVVPALPEVKPDDGSDRDAEADDDEIDENEIDDEEAVEVAPEAEYSWARVGQTFAEHVGPYVGPMLAGVPGLAKLLGAHGGKPKTDATTPGPGPSDPAPAGGDGSPPSGPVTGLDAAMLVRLRQIMAQLSPEEERFARSLIDEISPEDMASWIERLRAMSIPEAVAYVRTMFRKARDAAGDTEPVRASAPVAPATPRRAGHPARAGGPIEPTAARRPTSDTIAHRRSVPATQTSDGAVLRDGGTQAHLDRIERELNISERTAMRKHFAALSPSDRSLFVATLLMLPVADAVAVVRSKVGGHPAITAPPSPTSGDAPPIAPTSGPDETSRNRAASTSGRKRSGASASGAAPRDVTPPAADEPPPTAGPAPEPIAATNAAPIPIDAPARLDRNAHTHLAEVENTLTPDESLLMHNMIVGLSADEREVWLDKLLSLSVSDGAAMLRDAIHAATAQPTREAAATDTRQESDTALADRTPETSDELDAGDDLGDEPTNPDEPQASAAEATIASHEPPELPPPPTMPVITSSAALPTQDAKSLAHFQAIEDALTFAERMRANELAAQRPAAELRRWYADLVELSVPDAVAKIRAELARSDSDSHSTTKGGVS